MERLRAASKAARAAHRQAHKLDRLAAAQRAAARAYAGLPARAAVALVILGNFLVHVFRSESRPAEGSDAARSFDAVDAGLGLLFLAEFGLNLAANWRAWGGAPFTADAWNGADALIAGATALGMLGGRLAWMGQLRLLRVFRVPAMFKARHCCYYYYYYYYYYYCYCYYYYY